MGRILIMGRARRFAEISVSRLRVILFTCLGLLMVTGVTGLHASSSGHSGEWNRELIASVVDRGTFPRPLMHAGRDVGFSAVLDGRSVWIFGDTFLPGKAADGLDWRSSSWSWLSPYAASDDPLTFVHALGQDQMALQLLPHTDDELQFNLAHQGHESCPTGTACGSRHTPWPGAFITDPAQDNGVIFYVNMHTGPAGEWDFRSVSGSVASWTDPDQPAIRVEPPLFTDQEPDWGSAALVVNDDIFVYACEFDGKEKPCLLARVPFALATDRGQYRFWSGGQGWSEDWQSADPVFSGGSLFSVHFNAYMNRYLAWYMAGMAGEIHLRWAASPEGPWSEAIVVGQGEPAFRNWNYSLIAHPELARESGRIEVLSYTRPVGEMINETRLIEIHFK